ncbi:hypothetical protein AB833_11590 [Chromatiales bacterium (ex Bugula neritina AB1)]|nr:hypothetical protein AB833_11590 [Chromatiales bacterium (ex Bugula neritina AB1)]
MPDNGTASTGTLQWHSAALSELGYVRSVNEDALLDAREQSLWVVADGMGGHSFGDEASQTIVDQLISFQRSDNMAESITDIEKRLTQANTICRDKSQGQVMGSTVVALFVHEPYCFFIWAGDSRIYRLRDSRLEQMTEDHSYVQELVTLGEIRREDMEKHPSSNIITRAIGVHDELQLENQHTLIESGDRFLICSDGLFKDLEHDEIAKGLSHTTVEESVQSLVDLSLERGGRDNTTAIVVQAEFR